MDLEDAALELAYRGRRDQLEGNRITSSEQKENNAESGVNRGKVVSHHRGKDKDDDTLLTASAPRAPWNATIFIHTFGCGHNVSDGEYMAGLLSEAGYRITDTLDVADVYLLNSCTVKNPSEEHLINMMNRVRTFGKPIVVAGCVPQADPQNKQWNDVSVIGVRSIHQVVSVINEALQGNTVRLIGSVDSKEAVAGSSKVSRTSIGGPDGGDFSERKLNSGSGSYSSNARDTEIDLHRLDMPKIRRNKYIEIIPINVGCLNNCTYCKTKHARGDLKSWKIEEIVRRVRTVAKEGVKEIRLTSEDVGAYGIDLGTTIVALLKEIARALENTDVMIRVGMSNPPYLLRQVDEFASLLLHPNIYEFVHIPVQSGSDSILLSMKREYTVAEFRECVERIRRKVPNVSVATDIICAFPGEGDKEWRETLALCEEIRFPILNFTRFYPRRDTPAAAMPQIPTEVAKKRTSELTTFYNSYQTYTHLLGTVHRVSLLEVAHDKHNLVGHTKAYVQVLVSPEEAVLGETVFVIVTAVTKYSVTGKVIRARWDKLKAITRSRIHRILPTYPLLPSSTNLSIGKMSLFALSAVFGVSALIWIKNQKH